MDDINSIIECAEFCTQLPVHPRHPYAGELVFTAFSGSHQDAIKKGLAAQAKGGAWEVPYLPIDPADIGRSYTPIIRVNSQSGKAGVAFLLERDYGIKLPRGLQIDFSRAVQKISDATGREVSSPEIWTAFKGEYVNLSAPFALFHHHEDSTGNRGSMEATVSDEGVQHIISANGNGPIDAFVRAFTDEFQIAVRVASYEEHALGTGADATAIAFVELAAGAGQTVFGVGMHPNIISASLNAIMSAVNRSVKQNGRTRVESPAAASLP